MESTTRMLLCCLFSSSGLLGCETRDSSSREAPAASPQRAQSAEGVARETVRPETSAARPPNSAPVAIATRSGSRGLEVDLMRAAVTGGLFTVDLRYRNPTKDGVSVSIPVDHVSVIDDATARRYGAVKDQTGQFMAAPLENSVKADRVHAYVSPDKTHTLRVKFPAPPTGAETD